MKLEPADRAIISILNGRSGDGFEADELLRRSRIHGVSALLAEALREQGADLSSMPVFDQAVAAHALYDKLHLRRLREVLDALAAAHIEHLLLKGTPIAHLYYETPAVRSRGDTDLLVDPAAFDAAADVFASLGYSRVLDAGRRWQSYQSNFELADGVGCLHAFDLHRKLSDRQVFAKAFCWAELRAASIPVPGIHGRARTLTPVFLMLHACLHRATHMHAPYRVDGVEHPGDRLVWLHDIALIARRLSTAEWRRLTTLAIEKAMARVVLEGIEVAQALFPFDAPADALDLLADAEHEPSARLLDPAATNALVEDVMHIEGWRRKLALVAELAFPPREYLHARFGTSNDLLLPWLCVRRGVAGVVKQLRR